jgi:phosphoglycolate phosphatase
MTKPDSLIFDMDGTLWDATESYAYCWNLALKELGIEKTVSIEKLNSMMGWEHRKVFNNVFPEMTDNEQDRIANHISKLQDTNLEKLGGKLYLGVKEGLENLRNKYQLFIVSNCPANTIYQMMRATGIEHLITDSMAHGQNNMPKHHNIKFLVDKYRLQNPFYIGDTDSDRIQSELAGLPYVFVDYGFGTSDKYTCKFSSFGDFEKYFNSL